MNSSVALAKKKHAQVIAITSDEQSRLAELSDLNFASQKQQICEQLALC
ncbi:hypothetical protein S101258_00116 [Lactiplantibacillus plantarum subsp. plantarum]|uniref:Uncharacterized protein n=1 Tax=Lactiplantibacillus plantarum subsp. plantarum TaxID=337330 RepID=A0A2S3U9Z3_LACPN|nr:hypothetical protein S101258_00116 [Lactiplantibacillus plantarum subsp. plantarum]